MASVVVLIAAPGSGAISAEVVAALRDHGAGNFHWLSPGDAAEVDFFPRLGEFLIGVRNLPIDAAVVSTENRRKRLLVVIGLIMPFRTVQVVQIGRTTERTYCRNTNHGCDNPAHDLRSLSNNRRWNQATCW